MAEVHSDIPYRRDAQRHPGDEVKLHFVDGTYTVIHVQEDDDVHASIADLCDREGWSIHDITNYGIITQ